MHKKYSFKKSLKGLIPFIKPYKWQFIIAILMIFAFNISMVLAPTFEGMITTQLASDVAKSSSLTSVDISFGAIIKIVLSLVVIYIIKTVAQMISVVYLTNAIQQAMEDLRNALQNNILK